MNKILSAAKKVIQETGSDNIYDVLESLGIEINHKDFKNVKTQSCLMKNYENHFSIFIRRNLDYRYEQFLLAHELGHYILHHDENVSFYFLEGLYANRLEREANTFACCFLLSDIDYRELEFIDNMDCIIKEKGIPLDIWYSLNNL